MAMNDVVSVRIKGQVWGNQRLTIKVYRQTSGTHLGSTNAVPLKQDEAQLAVNAFTTLCVLYDEGRIGFRPLFVYGYQKSLRQDAVSPEDNQAQCAGFGFNMRGATAFKTEEAPDTKNYSFKVLTVSRGIPNDGSSQLLIALRESLTTAAYVTTKSLATGLFSAQLADNLSINNKQRGLVVS